MIKEGFGSFIIGIHGKDRERQEKGGFGGR